MNTWSHYLVSDFCRVDFCIDCVRLSLVSAPPVRSSPSHHAPTDRGGSEDLQREVGDTICPDRWRGGVGLLPVKRLQRRIPQEADWIKRTSSSSMTSSTQLSEELHQSLWGSHDLQFSWSSLFLFTSLIPSCVDLFAGLRSSWTRLSLFCLHFCSQPSLAASVLWKCSDEQPEFCLLTRH